MSSVERELPAGPPRLSDRVAIGVLTRTYPPALVDQVLAQTGRVERRQRLLPARLVVYYVLALALFAGVAYEEVLRCLVEALRGARWWPNPREPWRAWRMPAKSALVQARARLGAEPLRVLFEQAARPLATDQTKGAFYRGLRLVAIDGTCLDVADTPANQQAFGRPGTGRGQGVGAFPQVRLVGLAECGTHAITSVAVGPCTTGETTLAPAVLAGLGPGMLALADRGLFSIQLWRQGKATGASLLWRVKTGRGSPALPVDQELGDGSWLSRLGMVSERSHQRRREPIVVRVVDYTLEDPGRPGHRQRYRLVTSILDPTQAPPLNWPPCITSAGSWKAPWTSSRPTSAAPGRCCAPRPPKVSPKRSRPTCWSTTPSAR